MFIDPKGALMASAANVSRPRAIYGSVRADVSDPRMILAQLQQSFADFKAENENKLKAKADVLVDEKVERINASVSALQAMVDEANVKLAAMAAGAGTNPANGGQSQDERKYASAFTDYVRRGKSVEEVEAQQRVGIRAAMSVGSSPDGGYLAPIEWDRTITDKLKIISPMRDICSIQQISTQGFIKVFNDRAVGSGWVGEVAARPQTTNPQFSTVTYTPGEIYANPAASQQLLDDALINIESWLAAEVEAEFSRQEGLAFVNGDGTNKPKGILQYGAGSTHPFGIVPSVPTGDAAKLTPDGLINLVYSLPSEYTANARFIMNRSTFGVLRSFKDSTGQYLWQPSLSLGAPASILGFAVTEVAAMPNVAAGAIPIVFGDFERGYLIIDRAGVRLLRDPFTNKPYVTFYTTKRVGGGVLNPTTLRYQVVSAT